MISAIQTHLPDVLQFHAPQGGLFIWLRLPNGISSDILLPLAHREGVDFVPGSRFFPDGHEGQDWMRLNFVTQAPEKIEEGILRLSRAIEGIRGNL